MARTLKPSPSGQTGLARFFRFAERGTDLRTEILAGVTTYFVMAYIIFVNPSILSGGPLAQAGPPFNGALTATCLAAALMCIVMGLYSNYPFALARAALGRQLLHGHRGRGPCGHGRRARPDGRQHLGRQDRLLRRRPAPSSCRSVGIRGARPRL